MLEVCKMTLRKIETTDNQQVKKLIQTSLKSFGLDIPGTAYFDPQLGNLAEHYQQLTKANYWVVVDQAERVLACGGYGPFTGQSKICELQKLYVAEEAKGQGLANLLMTTILTEAKKDYQQIYLETCETLAVANILYKKYGFQPMPEPLEGSDHGAMDIWYIKKL